MIYFSKIAAISVTLISLQGCAALPFVAGSLLSAHDRSVKSVIKPTATKTVSITEEKYQFMPNAKEMDILCRTKLKEKVGDSYNDDLVSITHGRNVFLGMSNCTASHPI